ncbi:hypothetical protein FRB98_003894 [Tulasnella sp. 332]|nr:hypothetical protein FRB98_003894 [Tulasnella sp. 332]
MPLKFPSAVAELNLIAILSLLNFGSGYRAALHAANGRGAYDNIRALVLSLYLTSSEEPGPSNLLSAQGMTKITREQIAGLMNVSLHVEAPHPTMPAVTIGQLGGPLLEFVELITSTLQSTGNILVNNGYPDLGSFVMEALEDAKRAGIKKGLPPIAELVVEKPSSTDADPSTATSIPIPDTTSLPIFSDNVIPSMLVHFGILDLSSVAFAKLASAFPDPKLIVPTLLSAARSGSKTSVKFEPPEDGPQLSVEESYVLRAAAINACEIIVAAAKEIEVPDDKEKERWLRSITLPEIDGWLWAVAKDRPDYRKLSRYVTKPTIFF